MGGPPDDIGLSSGPRGFEEPGGAQCLGVRSALSAGSRRVAAPGEELGEESRCRFLVKGGRSGPRRVAAPGEELGEEQGLGVRSAIVSGSGLEFALGVGSTVRSVVKVAVSGGLVTIPPRVFLSSGSRGVAAVSSGPWVDAALSSGPRMVAVHSSGPSVIVTFSSGLRGDAALVSVSRMVAVPGSGSRVDAVLNSGPWVVAVLVSGPRVVAAFGAGLGEERGLGVRSALMSGSVMKPAVK